MAPAICPNSSVLQVHGPPKNIIYQRVHTLFVCYFLTYQLACTEVEAEKAGNLTKLLAFLGRDNVLSDFKEQYIANLLMQKKAYGAATGIDGLWCIQWFTSSQDQLICCVYVFCPQVKITKITGSI